MPTYINEYTHGAFLVPQGDLPIYFDAVMTETVTRNAEVTEFSVETGSNITDTYRIALTSIRLECFITQEPIDENTHPDGGVALFQYQSVMWDPYPPPSTLATVVGAITNPVGSVLKLLNQDPTSAAVNVLSWPTAFDSVATLLTKLDGLRKNATLVDVHCPNFSYVGYLLGEIETTRDASTGSGARISIELHQVNQVTTQATQVPEIPAKPEDTKSVNHGAQQTVPAPQPTTSFLSGAQQKFAPYLPSWAKPAS